MRSVATLMQEWSATCAFPARVRWFAWDDGTACACEDRWHHQSALVRVWAAIGCALVVIPHGSVVVVGLSATEMVDSPVRRACAIAQIIGIHVLCWGDIESEFSTTIAVAEPIWQPRRGKYDLTAVAPVHVPQGCVWRELATPLADISARLVTEQTPGWQVVGAEIGRWIAYAAAAVEGMRSVVSISSAELGDAWSVLAVIGTLRLPITLVVQGAPPPLGFFQALPHWWVCAPAADHVRACVTRAINSRDAMIIVTDAAAPWQASPEPHEPGGGRWIHADAHARVVVVTVGSGLPAVDQARHALARIQVPIAVWECTSVQPLALPADQRVVVAVEGDVSGFGLSVRAQCGATVAVCAVGETPVEIAATVRLHSDGTT